MIKVALIIPAGGSGSRMNSELPKPILELAGKPIIYWTIRRFCQVDVISQIIIPAHESIIDRVKILAKQAIEDSGRSSIKLEVLLGGEERINSISNAIPFVDASNQIIAVHDAVRPFVSKAVIENCISLVIEKKAVIPGLPQRETLKEVDPKTFLVANTPNRSRFWSIQTPQVFDKDLFVDAYQKAKQESFFGTDDASVIENYGQQVTVCLGNSQNVKITYPLDLQLSKLLIENENYD